MGQLGNMFVSSLRRAERCVHHFLGEQLQLGEHCNTSVLRGAVDPNGFSTAVSISFQSCAMSRV